MTRLYTIGHSRHPMERFVGLMRQHDLDTLVDVRSQPYSKWAPQFKKEPLQLSLEASGLRYVFLGHELGGKGHADYGRRARDEEFRMGIDRLVSLAAESVAAILCAEEDPSRCHRRLLITPALQRQGVDVIHIRGDGDTQLESELSDPQRSLF